MRRPRRTGGKVDHPPGIQIGLRHAVRGGCASQRCVRRNRRGRASHRHFVIGDGRAGQGHYPGIAQDIFIDQLSAQRRKRRWRTCTQLFDNCKPAGNDRRNGIRIVRTCRSSRNGDTRSSTVGQGASVQIGLRHSVTGRASHRRAGGDNTSRANGAAGQGISDRGRTGPGDVAGVAHRKAVLDDSADRVKAGLDRRLVQHHCRGGDRASDRPGCGIADRRAIRGAGVDCGRIGQLGATDRKSVNISLRHGIGARTAGRVDRIDRIDRRNRGDRAAERRYLGVSHHDICQSGISGVGDGEIIGNHLPGGGKTGWAGGLGQGHCRGQRDTGGQRNGVCQSAQHTKGGPASRCGNVGQSPGIKIGLRDDIGSRTIGRRRRPAGQGFRQCCGRTCHRTDLAVADRDVSDVNRPDIADNIVIGDDLPDSSKRGRPAAHGLVQLVPRRDGPQKRIG